ncbi:MAG TPA: class IV adenylate cyclase [Tepidisphaeraceae bacterium]|jgi:adenylate cyclase class 2
MALEIEAKMKVDDFDAVRAKLVECGATRVGAVLETNTFFDTPDRSLLAADRGLRLRRAKDLASGDERFVVTVKGPAQSGPLKTREEAEVNVDDGERAIAVLRALGYEPQLSFEKRRETWETGGCTVELDELPVLGRFVEIEGPDERSVLHVREALGLSGLPLIKTGYITMLTRFLKETGDARRSITF